MSTVSNTNIVGTKTGPELVAEIATQIGNADTELDARAKDSDNATISGNWSFTGIPITNLPTGGGLGWRFLMGDIEGGHTTAHEIEVRGSAAGDALALTPKIDGTSTQTKEWGFDFANEVWFCETDLYLSADIYGGGGFLDLTNFEWDGDAIWTAGNLNPSAMAIGTTKQRKKVTVLTSSTGIAVNPAGDGEHYVVQLAHTTTITFTLPTGADSDLGEHYKISGTITIENVTGAGAVTLAATGADKVEENGTQDNTVGNVMTLAYEIIRFNPGSERRLVVFAWNS